MKFGHVTLEHIDGVSLDIGGANELSDLPLEGKNIGGKLINLLEWAGLHRLIAIVILVVVVVLDRLVLLLLLLLLLVGLAFSGLTLIGLLALVLALLLAVVGVAGAFAKELLHLGEDVVEVEAVLVVGRLLRLLLVCSAVVVVPLSEFNTLNSGDEESSKRCKLHEI